MREREGASGAKRDTRGDMEKKGGGPKMQVWLQKENIYFNFHAKAKKPHTHTHLLSLFPLHVKKAPSFILSSCNLTVTGTVALLSQLAGTPLSAHEPQGGNICIVCLHPAPGAHTHTH